MRARIFPRIIGVAVGVVVISFSANADTRDVYSEINVTGAIDVRIVSAGQPACAQMWWVKRLTGSVEQLGKVCGSRQLEVPSFLGISLASKLRASAAAGVEITVVGSRERVASKITFK